MDYELAKKLDAAGFPQGGTGRWIGAPDALVMRATDRVYVPTLEELLAASGSQFNRLEYLSDATEPRRRWVAWSTNLDSARHYGGSPAEAVAHLWLGS